MSANRICVSALAGSLSGMRTANFALYSASACRLYSLLSSYVLSVDLIGVTTEIAGLDDDEAGLTDLFVLFASGVIR